MQDICRDHRNFESVNHALQQANHICTQNFKHLYEKTNVVSIFFCVGMMYSGEYDACDVTLSADIRFRNITYSNRPDRVAQLAEHWASIPKVVGSIPTVARHIFQACPVWISALRVTSQTSNAVSLS